MSFFGFDSTLPRDRGHNTRAPGFTQAADPFAGLERPGDNEDALDFEETYDGLGDQLDETDDALNDDTFGGDAAGESGPKVGKDYDFFGQTAKVSSAIKEEHAVFDRLQPAQRAAPAPSTSSYQPAPKPARSGYEKYQEELPELQADASLWGTAPKKPTAPAAPPASSTNTANVGRKMLSLEEVEAQMRAQAKRPSPAQPVAAHPPPPVEPQQPQHAQQFAQQYPMQPQLPFNQQYNQAEVPLHMRQGPPTQILQRPQPHAQPIPPQPPAQPAPHPTHILQNPNRPSGDQQRFMNNRGPPPSGPRNQVPIITHPQQLAGLSEEERAAYLMEEAKRAKRNHKIFLLSRDNGLMTPQDKNFITRIQLQQLVTATGNPNDHGTDASLAEDFYCQVHHHLRGNNRLRPDQPLTNFAQTYLFQTGGRYGGRRQNRADNHVQRMEQQVQRAVEAAKNKPKNKQLIIEGSLGKISFSNAKTPKPLLNIKRNDSERKMHSNVTGLTRKAVLQDIERSFLTVMKLDDHERSAPPPMSDDTDPELAARHMEYREEGARLNSDLWAGLKIHQAGVDFRDPNHPFIAFLSFAKGKKVMPRIFYFCNHEQKTTILTMIVLHLDKLDVVRGALFAPGEQPNLEVRQNVELFSMSVMPPLFQYFQGVHLNIVGEFLDLILDQDIEIIARTRIGLSMLTMVLTQSEVISSAQDVALGFQYWDNWLVKRNRLFDLIEPLLPHLFPGTVTTGEDAYVWVFLASLGNGGSVDQQQRLVSGVRDRVLSTVRLARSLPPQLGIQRLAQVNLFMQALGLDVTDLPMDDQ